VKGAEARGTLTKHASNMRSETYHSFFVVECPMFQQYGVFIQLAPSEKKDKNKTNPWVPHAN
jgi:hypothetical protein